MAAAPTEAEIWTQWQNAIDILETFRTHCDSTLTGQFDALEQSLEGQYLPAALSQFVSNFRGNLSALLDPTVAAAVLSPIFYEYAGRIDANATQPGGFGSAYRSPAELFRAIYEWFVLNSYTVTTRAITYDTTATAGAGNVGNGAMSRLTVDQNGHKLEACHVETKRFRCRSDQNSGAQENAEVFEVVGEASSPDNLLRGSYGSGEAGRTTITSKNAGSGRGGSLLTNSSWSEYDSTAGDKFNGWTEEAGGDYVSQDTTNYYRPHPGSQTNASLKITGGSGTVTLTQPLSAMRVGRLDPNVPYFLRVMVNKTVGTASGGNFVLRLGSQTVTTAISALGSNWVEVIVPLDANLWLANFNADPLTVEVEWASSTSGFLLVDDAIFAPMDLIDGTYWLLRGNAATHTPWLLDDVLSFADTGGAPGTGILQYWLWLAGFGYLPSSGTPTLADPS